MSTLFNMCVYLTIFISIPIFLKRKAKTLKKKLVDKILIFLIEVNIISIKRTL